MFSSAWALGWLAFGITVLASMAGPRALAWAYGRLSAPVGDLSGHLPEIQPPPLDEGAIEALMSGRVAFYTYPSKKADEVSDDVNPQTDGDIRTALAVQKERLDGLSNTIEREFARMAEALGKHAEAVNNAFTAMKAEYVNKGDLRTEIAKLAAENLALKTEQSKQGRLVYGTAGIMLTAMIVALVAVSMGVFK